MGVLFLVFLLFLASEALLFISFFWASFHSLSSPTLGICPGEGFYLPDPCELTFANTLLLSNAAVSLGGAFVIMVSFFLQDYISFIFSLVFFFYVFSFGVVVFLSKFINLRVSEVHLFYNIQLFYWHFLEILWLFIFL